MSKKGKIDLLSDVDFKKLIENSKSIREVLKKLNYKNLSGSMHKKIQERVKKDNLSLDHMVSRFKNGGGIKISLDEILVENSTYQNIGRLKIRLVNEKILKYECVKCNNDGQWNGEKLVLQLDHINGVRDDHRIKNLRFLCPNCHSQTKTFGGKNIK